MSCRGFTIWIHDHNKIVFHFLSFFALWYSYKNSHPFYTDIQIYDINKSNVVVLLLFQFIYDSLKTIFYTLYRDIAILMKSNKGDDLYFILKKFSEN